MSTALDSLPREVRRQFVGRMRAGRAVEVLWQAHKGDEAARAFVGRVVSDARAGHARARAFAAALVEAQLELASGEVVTGGFDLFKDTAKAFRDLGHDVDNALKPIGGVQGLVSDVQGVVSLIPGIGTGISSAIGAADALLSGGSPLEIAIRTAYGAIPIPPGVRTVTDTVLNAVLSFAKGGNVTDAIVAVARDRVPDGFPRKVFDTLIGVIGHAIKHHPATPAPQIVHAPAALQAHYTTQYTQGAAEALRQGAPSIPPPVAAHLATLPLPALVHAQAAVAAARPLPPAPPPPHAPA
jgi:hypothetical protein